MNKGKPDIINQLNLAMSYIEEHIEDNIIISKVASVTAYSPYHFGRLFYYIADMPLSEYIRRRKLSLAAVKLQKGNDKIIDLAVLYGYDNADSFSRAFMKQHGVNPSNARKPGVNFILFPPLTFQIKIKGVQAMNWRIEEREAFEIFGIERIFKDDETDKIPDFWKECHVSGKYEKLIGDSNNVSGAFGLGSCIIHAICGHINPVEENLFPYMIFALKTDKAKTEGYKIFTVPKSTWAVFRASVDHSGSNYQCQIPSLFQRAYSEWLPSSGYEKDIAPDMEIYGEDFDEVWIPVKRI